MCRIANSDSPSSTRSRRSAVLGALMAVLAGVAAHDAAAFELRNGVVVDPEAGLVYLMHPDGGVDAVRLASGNVQWHSGGADRPIAVSEAGLLAQVETSSPGRLQLAVIDGAGHARNGATVALPAGVEAPVADGLSHRFLIHGTPNSNGRGFLVEWQSTFLAPRGALILDRATDPRVRTGAFAFDPATGAVVDTTAPPSPLASRRLEVPEGQRLSVPGRQYFSADGRNVLASVPGSGSAADTYEWTFFDSSGTRLGSFPSRVDYAPFFVTGELVVLEQRPGARLQNGQMVEEPLALRAVSLSNGSEQWAFAIRDTEYRGPFPP